MTPGARLQAAVDILETLRRESRGTDRVLREYFRHRRYAGSKDRRAVNERVYGVLRRYGRLLWRLEAAGAADPDPRLLVVADLVLHDGLGMAGVDELFDGRGHAPKHLAAAERAALDALASAPTDPLSRPVWVEGNIPAWLAARLGERFGADLAGELAALNIPAPVDLRVNSLRADGPETQMRARVRASLAKEDVVSAPTPHAPLGLRLAARTDLRRTEAWKAGEIEVQDEGSQLVAGLVDARPGMTVVDYCAGAGGKSLALAAYMAGRGRLVACDSDPKRLARLAPRARRAGADFVEARLLDGPDPLADLAGSADRVLVDVPCTGMGAWRRDPAARWRLRPAEINRFATEQAAILAAAAPLARPGGRLIYATCAFLATENEDQIARFLASHPDFRVRPAREAALAGGIAGEACGGDGDYLRVTPGRQGCDGFFAAVLERAGGDSPADPEAAFSRQ